MITSKTVKSAFNYVLIMKKTVLFRLS